MPLMREIAELMSQEQMEAGVIEEMIDKEDLLAILPFMQVAGKAYVYDREKTLSEASFIDVNDVVPEEASEFEEATARLKILIGDVDVDKFLNVTMSNVNPQKALQIAAKAKGLARKLRRTIAIGDSSVNPLEFDGIKKLVSPSQVLSAGTNGNALSLSMLDELIDAVPNSPDVLMMRSGTIRALRSLLRHAGGLEPAHIMMENFGRPMLTHNGVPIIVNDFLPKDEAMGTATATTSIYAMRLNEADGLHGIYGGPNGGVIIEDIGTVQNKDATRTRLKWYCGMALKSTKSLARVAGVTNV